MKLKYKSNNGRLEVEIEGEQQKDIFRSLGTFQEVFEHSKCGKCGEENIRFVVRTNADGDDFYELHCQDCGARLAFGQHKNKDGTLFPKRKDGEGKWLPNGGWVKFVPPTTKGVT